MANWASTSYRIEGSKSDLQRVFNVIDDFMSERRKPIEEDASKEWEGNIVKALGATDEQVSKSYLRGFIQDYEKDGDNIRIEAEEAWGATDLRHVLAQLMPGLTVYYIVEEPGCEVYATNDDEGKYFPERYYVDTCIGGNYYSDYFKKEKEAMKFAALMLGRETISKEELESWNEDHGAEGDFIYIHEFKYVA